MPASSSLTGLELVVGGPVAVVVEELRDCTIQKMSRQRSAKKMIVMIASKACFAAMVLPPPSEPLPVLLFSNGLRCTGLVSRLKKT